MPGVVVFVSVCRLCAAVRPLWRLTEAGAAIWLRKCYFRNLTEAGAAISTLFGVRIPFGHE